MRTAVNPLLVEQDPQLDQSWRRFVAVLCFIEFHCRFVLHGTELWRGLVHSDNLWGDWYTVAGAVLFIIRAFFLYLCGRALWTGRGDLSFCVCGAIAASVLEIIDSTIGTIVGESHYAYQTFTWPPSSSTGTGITAFPVLANNIEHLPWLLLLLAVVWGRRWWSARLRIHLGSWLLPATVWVLWWLSRCLGLWGSYYPRDLNFGLPHTCYLLFPVYVWPGTRWIEITAGVIALISAIVTIISLYRGWKLAGLGIVLVLLCEASGHDAGYQISLLVNAAIEQLVASCPYPVANPLPWPWVLFNNYAGQDVLINIPAALGPWLLIAVFAWRVPIHRALGEPSLPYPQYLCRRCHYNLHGLHGRARCPECGAELAWDAAASK